MYPCLSRMALDYLSIPGMVQLFVGMLHQPHNLLKQHLLTSNRLSAAADSYFRMFKVVYLHKSLVRYFALVVGAYEDISMIRTFVLSLLWLMSMERKRNSKKVGIKSYYNVISFVLDTCYVVVYFLLDGMLDTEYP